MAEPGWLTQLRERGGVRFRRDGVAYEARTRWDRTFPEDLPCVALDDLSAILQADEVVGGDTPPNFDLTVLTADHKPFKSRDGRLWTRAVFGRTGVCAAEDEDGVLTVWDEAELFEAVFRGRS